MSAPSAESPPLRLPAWTRLPPQQLLALMLVAATAIAVIAGGWMWSTAPEYKILYANLSDRDGGAVIASLQQMNVPYKFAEGGGALLVPAQLVHDTRLRLASQGLPKGGPVGFELMEGQRFGASQFLEQVNYQRGLEGELSRSIQALKTVQSARVHLALSRGTAFLREQAKPSASVLVHLYPGRTLDPMQVAAIVHLVSNSVPELSTKNVTVVDQNGTLLSGEAGATPGLDTKQLKYRQEIEQGYVRRVESILAPVLGDGNVKAQVSAELDFNEVEHAEETYKPNQKPDEAAIRAQQTSEAGGTAAAPGASGVPGALSNQPPVPATAPITAPAVQQNASAPAAATTNQRRDSSVSYEVDKSIRHTKIAQGRLKRLSIAVVVNDRKITDASGKTTTKPLTDDEKTQITELVKGVMGYDKERGDTLSVINSTFNTPPVEAVPEVPLWKDPETIALAKDAGKYLLIAAFVLFLVLKVLRPMAKNLARLPALAPAPVDLLPPAANATAGAAAQPQQQEGDRYENALRNARQIAKQDPKIVAHVVKDWVAGNEQ
ncbi:MAG TPA: flagellar basal-body MS-ring/collar protein FliF [Burkholderiales bacterium]|nr:flagellar basal-body MS-ring/collar protein FliF [Burkholderiales bacterium]